MRPAARAGAWLAFAADWDGDGRSFEWRADAEDEIAGSWDVGSERPEVRVRIRPDGGVRSVALQRWGRREDGSHGYLPFGCEVHAERRFGEVVVPSLVTAGWWFGTPRWRPFLEAQLLSVEVAGRWRPVTKGDAVPDHPSGDAELEPRTGEPGSES